MLKEIALLCKTTVIDKVWISVKILWENVGDQEEMLQQRSDANKQGERTEWEVN